MTNWYNNLSNANKILIQSLLAILVAAITSGLTAGWQSYVTADQLDLSIVAGVFLTTFALAFGKAMYSFVPAHIQQELAFLRDQYSALSSSHQVLINHVQTLSTSAKTNSAPASPQPLQGALVHIYTSGDAQITAPVEVESQPTQKAPAVVQPSTLTNPGVFVGSGTYIDPLASPLTAPQPVVQIPFPVKG